MVSFRGVPVLLALASPTLAAAQDDARQRFDAGVKAYDQGRYEAALEAFRAAYAARPSPLILRNVALTLAKLGRNAEAVTTLERAKALGGADPALADRTLDALRSKIASVRVAVVVHVAPGARAPEPTITLDGAVVPRERALEPMWIDPGEHTFGASAPGYDDDEVTFTARAGERDLTANLTLAPHALATGTVRVRASVARAEIRIDGALVARGAWQGQLASGKHRLEASVAGYTSAEQDVDVSERSREEVTLDLRPLPSRVIVPASPARWYFGVTAGAFGAELPAGRGLPIGSFTFGARFGRRYGSYVGVELDGELVRGTAERTEDQRDIEWVYTHAALGPGLRVFTAEGSPRFTAAAIGGVINQSTHRAARVGGQTVEASTGGAPTAFLQLEGGAQIDFSGAIGAELVAFVGMMGVSDAHLSGSVISRAGGKATLVFSF